MKHKRVLLYVHYNKRNQLSEYVVDQLTKVKPLFTKVVFITNSKVTKSDMGRLEKLYDIFIQRENIGFDFGAWRDGIYKIGWKELEKYNSITLMNDTCFGPVYPLEDIYKKMENKKVDFWGMTDHGDSVDGMPGTNESIPYHIQSYFTVFNRRIIQSKAFRLFWKNIEQFTDVEKVIQLYETQLTGILQDAGASFDVVLNTESYDKNPKFNGLNNFSEFQPKLILEKGVPFIKVKAFTHTSFATLEKLIARTGYDTLLIKSHLEDIGIDCKRPVGRTFKSSAKNMAKRIIRSDVTKRVAHRFPSVTKLGKKVIERTFKVSFNIDNHQVSNSSSSYIYNPDLAINFAEHAKLLQDNKTYWHETESDEAYQRGGDDPRVVAIYLPQFHPFKENNEAWGKGFTEWTNVTASYARFVGQQQPTLPSDLGYYDLRLPLVIKQQIDLAKKYGIYGFQFYYYWFSGKKVMDTPINTVLENPDWDFNFSICWANENWTRKWDGGDKDIIFEQKDLPGDPLKFIQDVAPILNDKRYITEDGKPILTVYRVDLLTDPNRHTKIWREYFSKEFGKELWLVGCTNFKNFKPSDYGFDALMDFTPTGSTSAELKPWVGDEKIINNQFTNKLIDVGWSGLIADYRYIAKQEVSNLDKNINDYKTISPSWCNEARRKGKDGVTFQNSSPEIFAHWLDKVLDSEINIKHKKSPIVFLNAWNEWAESAMIEPSVHMGHNTLLRVAETISKYSTVAKNRKSFPSYGIVHSVEAKLAVVVHLYYIDLWPSIEKKLRNINTAFDLYVSVSSSNKDFKVENINKYHNRTNIVEVPNRGRDVLPFIMIMNRIRGLGYEHVLKIHTKKSRHRKDGADWFKDVIGNLLPNDNNDLYSTLNNEDCGIIGPRGHIVSLSRHLGSNKVHLLNLIYKLTNKKDSQYLKHAEVYPFIGSTMFWARVDYLTPLLDLYLMPSDFESEQGQIDGTMAHAIERILGGILHDITNRDMHTVDASGSIERVEKVHYNQEYKYAK